VGWRRRLAENVAPTIASRTPLRQAQVRKLLGVAFLGLSVNHLLTTLRRARRAPDV